MEPVNLVVVTHNAIQYTLMTIESIIENTTYPYCLTVVDNASTDGTQDFLRSIKPESHMVDYKLVLSPTNLRYGPATNIGFEQFSSQYTVLANNDIYVYPNWLEEMLRVMKEDPTISMLGPLRPELLGRHPYNNSYTLDWLKSLSPDLSAKEELAAFSQTNDFNQFHRDMLSHNSGIYGDLGIRYLESPPAQVVTCLALLDSGRVRQVGGMADPELSFVEDTDLTWRLATGRNIDGTYTAEPTNTALTSRAWVFHARHKSYNIAGDRVRLIEEATDIFYGKWRDVIHEKIRQKQEEGLDIENLLTSKEWWPVFKLNERFGFWKDGRLIDNGFYSVGPEAI